MASHEQEREAGILRAAQRVIGTSSEADLADQDDTRWVEPSLFWRTLLLLETDMAWALIVVIIVGLAAIFAL